MTPQKAGATGNSLSRRSFLALSGAASAAIMAPSWPASLRAADAPKKHPIGLELYSVRTELARDLPNTLRAVAKIGYETVEFFAPYFGWTLPYAKDVRGLMDDLGLRCYTTHNHIESFTPGDTMSKAIELNQILGARILVLASAPKGKAGAEGWKELGGKVTAAVEQLKPHGLTAGFHNHQTEWAKLDNGQSAMEVLAASTPNDFVLQLDVGTCVEAGVDPVAWIKANPGRIKSIHLKDWAPGERSEEKSYRVLFGEGVSPWKQITAAAESVGGVEYYYIEQEGSRFPELETAQRCLDAWKALRAKA